MNRKISVEDLARYVAACCDLAELVRDAIVAGELEDEDIVLALNEFASAADNIADITDSLQTEKTRLN